MGMILLKCPSCGADLNLDDSREFGFCSYCGNKVQINEKINVNVVHKNEQESAASLFQKVQKCMDTATIDNDSVMEGLFYGRQAIERIQPQDRGRAADRLAKMYTQCISRLGKEMVATIKTYNNQERNGIALRQTHNALKSMVVVPEYIQGCSIATMEELERVSVQTCRSLTGWAKQAAKIYNHNQAYCSNIQKQASVLRASQQYSGDRKRPVKKPWYKKWWLWVIFGVAFFVVLFIILALIGGNSSEQGTTNQYQNAGTGDTNNIEEQTEQNKITFGSTIQFDDLEITFGNDYYFETITNEFSDHNGQAVVVLPVHIRNMSEGNHSLNLFYYKIFGSQGKELEDISSYFLFDGASVVGFDGELRPEASSDTNFYFLYDGDGTYYITFDNWSTKQEAEFDIVMR